jgi:hypothetical protein
MTEADGGDIVTADDVAALNRATVTRAAAFVRMAGTALVVAGVVFLTAWAWVVVRQQQRLDDEMVFTGVSEVGPEDGVSMQERIDVLTTSLSLLFFGALLVAVGLASRLLADHTVARAGGTLTGYEAGDVVTTEGPDNGDDQPPGPYG